ncbi:hypothetical protein MMC17_004411 [Xylographa soralifera]|nr:hypothetical protein [Xylographa soralifera]
MKSSLYLAALPLIFSYSATAAYLPQEKFSVLGSRRSQDAEVGARAFLATRDAHPNACAGAFACAKAGPFVAADELHLSLGRRSDYIEAIYRREVELLSRDAKIHIQSPHEIKEEFQKAGHKIKEGFDKAGNWVKTKAAPWLKNHALEIVGDVVSALPIPGVEEAGLAVKAASVAEKIASAAKKGVSAAKKVEDVKDKAQNAQQNIQTAKQKVKGHKRDAEAELASQLLGNIYNLLPRSRLVARDADMLPRRFVSTIKTTLTEVLKREAAADSEALADGRIFQRAVDSLFEVADALME